MHRYLIADPDGPPLIHHQRQADGSILTRLISEGMLRFGPPGFEIAADHLFGCPLSSSGLYYTVPSLSLWSPFPKDRIRQPIRSNVVPDGTP